ncbi:MAG: hypothetical protein IJU69_05595, partial [Bacteroidales bacterium]|nr:hypothetical protein [Bacteroidales bacterium]
MGELETSIQYLGGVGPKRAELLKQEFGISTLGDLISFYPFRYIDRSRIVPIASVDSDVSAVQIRGMVVISTLYGLSGAVIQRRTFDKASGREIVQNAPGAPSEIKFNAVK